MNKATIGEKLLRKKINFTVLIEKAANNYSAYSPDLPGCVATGKTPEEAEKNMVEAIQMHIEGLKEDHLPIPISTA